MAVVVTVVEIAKCAQEILAAAPARSPACQVALAGQLFILYAAHTPQCALVGDAPHWSRSRWLIF